VQVRERHGREVVMYVGVVHTIRDADGWMEMLRSTDASSFPGLELLSTGTSADIDRALCLWRAPSLETAQSVLDETVGQYAQNDCFALADETVVVAGPVSQAASV
jgi:hypothetical protein